MQGVLDKAASFLMQSMGQLHGPVIVVFLLFQHFVEVSATSVGGWMVVVMYSEKLGLLAVLVLSVMWLMWQLR